METLRFDLLIVAGLLTVLPATSVAQPKLASETVYVTERREVSPPKLPPHI